jgi:hypothetical protein
MSGGEQFPADRLPDDEPSHDLHVTAGRAGGAANKHREHQQDLDVRVPLREISRRVPGGVQQRPDLEGGLSERVFGDTLRHAT